MQTNGWAVMASDWISTAAEEVRAALTRPSNADPGERSTEEQAVEAFTQGIQPVWDEFTQSIRDTAARFNRSVGRDLIVLPAAAADNLQLRADWGSWTQTIDIRLDRTARCIVGQRSGAAPTPGQPLGGVAMPTLTLQVAKTPMRFDHHHMTADEAGSVVVKRLVSDLRRHLPTSSSSRG